MGDRQDRNILEYRGLLRAGVAIQLGGLILAMDRKFSAVLSPSSQIAP